MALHPKCNQCCPTVCKALKRFLPREPGNAVSLVATGESTICWIGDGCVDAVMRSLQGTLDQAQSAQIRPLSVRVGVVGPHEFKVSARTM
jgi:hypothetical protein